MKQLLFVLAFDFITIKEETIRDSGENTEMKISFLLLLFTSYFFFFHPGICLFFSVCSFGCKFEIITILIAHLK